MLNRQVSLLKQNEHAWQKCANRGHLSATPGIESVLADGSSFVYFVSFCSTPELRFTVPFARCRDECNEDDVFLSRSEAVG
jgi:hypothetical protein